MRTDFLTRSLMFVPAHNDRLMQSASRSNADILLLDIEDSVQPIENKQVARDKIVQYVREGLFKDRILFQSNIFLMYSMLISLSLPQYTCEYIASLIKLLFHSSESCLRLLNMIKDLNPEYLN